SGLLWNCSKPCLSSGRLCCSGCCTGPHGPTSTFAVCVCLLSDISERLLQRRSDLLPAAASELALPSRPAIHLQPIAPVPDGPGLNVRHQRLPRIELSPGDDDHVAVPAASAADQLRDAAAAGHARC